ncbi:hypothetical protein AVEN_208197-1 [Araneus ventricosus]|uniref:Transposase Tc1-like domain-containing protein n=1 Tax=Araneus ventricosus TaxID=182803 RepID=A0A4Y2NYF4_ARAVE|nr:hypothetical protein AVEN_208197-1 [Araneus ventricosus]
MLDKSSLILHDPGYVEDLKAKVELWQYRSRIAALKLNVSSRTVRRVHQLSLSMKLKIRKANPEMEPHHMDAKLQFGHQHISWTERRPMSPCLMPHVMDNGEEPSRLDR